MEGLSGFDTLRSWFPHKCRRNLQVISECPETTQTCSQCMYSDKGWLFSIELELAFEAPRSTRHVCVASEEGTDPVTRAGQRVISLTPTKSNLQNSVSDGSVSFSAPFCWWSHHRCGLALDTLTSKAMPNSAQLRRQRRGPSTGLQINGACSTGKQLVCSSVFAWCPAWLSPS